MSSINKAETYKDSVQFIELHPLDKLHQLMHWKCYWHRIERTSIKRLHAVSSAGHHHCEWTHYWRALAQTLTSPRPPHWYNLLIICIRKQLFLRVHSRTSTAKVRISHTERNVSDTRLIFPSFPNARAVMCSVLAQRCKSSRLWFTLFIECWSGWRRFRTMCILGSVVPW